MARYQPVADLTPYVAELRTKSMARRKDDPRFIAQNETIERVRMFQEKKDISLNLEDRLALVHEERAIAKMESEALKNEALKDEESDDEGVSKEKSRDIVLQESENILEDFIELTNKKDPKHEDSVLENARGGK